ncbi:coiled-coil domain-containing protein 40-like, partial [Drosophila serrata]|uniref:coiled-coil domain-containing protein 40-like n=1 Tax=Drosophila serrata TaxID=7274 RepID=UPI000A1D1631
MFKTEDIGSCDLANFSNVDPGRPPEPDQLALLSPNHPLLGIFQSSLKDHLLRTKHELENEISEIQYQEKFKVQRLDEEGLALYNMQQQIGLRKEQIREISVVIEKHLQNRQNEEVELNSLKRKYEERVILTKTKKNLYYERMVELKDTQSLSSNIKKWTYDVEDEIENAKRIVSRDALLQKQLSREKRKSDILFFRLDMEVKKRESELNSIYEEESTMKDIVNILNMTIFDANIDLE